MAQYKMIKIEVPKTTIQFQNGKIINKFYENLRGVFNLKTKDMNFEKSMQYADIFKSIKKHEDEKREELLMSEKDFKKVFELVKSTPGWGDFDGQVELYDAFENYKEAGFNTDYKEEEN